MDNGNIRDRAELAAKKVFDERDDVANLSAMVDFAVAFYEQERIDSLANEPVTGSMQLLRDRHGDAWLFEGDKARIVWQRGWKPSDENDTDVHIIDEIRKMYGPLTPFFSSPVEKQARAFLNARGK